MEIIELAHQRKAFMPAKDRYKYPHREAMRLRLLWTYDKPPSQSRDAQEVKDLYKEACEYARMDDKLFEIERTITKGLKLDPRFHALYAVKGEINARKEQWNEAIENFERARATAKYDKKLSPTQAAILYNKQLIENYSQRGHWYRENGFAIEAASDYEQDNLLDILRKLDKYDAFRLYWYQFASNTSATRAVFLLTLHAEYKIYLREIVAARQILLRALDLDKNNAKTRELMRIVYETGRTMAMHALTWCMYSYYEKALLTVEKARDCDPHNLEYVLLKTILLRLSGRLTEAASWLQNVDKDFYKFVEPRQEIAQRLILGKLTFKQIKEQLVEQWHSIKYDMAMKSS